MPVMVVDEPIVVTHALDGQLHAFYNVCRHRAGQVARTRGNPKSLQCQYHGWTYGLDGALRACPEMDDGGVPEGRLRTAGHTGRPMGTVCLRVPGSGSAGAGGGDGCHRF